MEFYLEWLQYFLAFTGAVFIVNTLLDLLVLAYGGIKLKRRIKRVVKENNQKEAKWEEQSEHFERLYDEMKDLNEKLGD